MEKSAEEEASCGDNWVQIQEELKRRMIKDDNFCWKLPSATTGSGGAGGEEEPLLRYIGGVDVSFAKEDPSLACAVLVVLDLSHQLQVVCEDRLLSTITVPYIPGFLAFREAPLIMQLLRRMKANGSPFYPQVLLVDGNGLLHPRGFGLASHLGVLADVPTIGIGKNLHHVDGLSHAEVRRLLVDEENRDGDVVALSGRSGFEWGAAIRASSGSLKPVFVSVGHRVSLNTAVAIARMTCKFRIPEPIRQADIRGRQHLQSTCNGGEIRHSRNFEAL